MIDIKKTFLEASESGDTTKVKACLALNVKILCTDSSGDIALLIACANNNKEIVEILLEHDSSSKHINYKNAAGWTTLMQAAHYGYTEIVEILLKHSVDVTLKDEDGKTAIDYIMLSGPIRKLLTDYLNDQYLNYVAKKDIDKVKSCLAMGVDIYHQNEDGDNGLTYASCLGQEEIVEFLVRHDNSPKHILHKNKNGKTPLTFACQHGYKKIVEFLLSANSSSEQIHHVMRLKYTALIFASMYCHKEIVEILLHYNEMLKKSDDPKVQQKSMEYIDWQDEYEKTALMYAAETGKIEIVRILLDNNASATIKDIEGKSAIDVVCNRCENETLKKEIIELLTNHEEKSLGKQLKKNLDKTTSLINDKQQDSEIEKTTVAKKNLIANRVSHYADTFRKSDKCVMEINENFGNLRDVIAQRLEKEYGIKMTTAKETNSYISECRTIVIGDLDKRKMCHFIEYI